MPPEHCGATPPACRHPASFVWHDFGDQPAEWLAWLRHRSFELGAAAEAASFDHAMAQTRRCGRWGQPT